MRAMERALILAALVMGAVLALAGCASVPPPPAPIPTPIPGASCADACQNGARLGCDTNPECEAVCQNVQNSGAFTYDTGCLAGATTCAAWSACFP